MSSAETDHRDDAQETERTPAVRLNLDDTAQFFSVSVPTVKTWIFEGCPALEHGGAGRSAFARCSRLSCGSLRLR